MSGSRTPAHFEHHNLTEMLQLTESLSDCSCWLDQAVATEQLLPAGSGWACRGAQLPTWQRGLVFCPFWLVFLSCVMLDRWMVRHYTCGEQPGLSCKAAEIPNKQISLSDCVSIKLRAAIHAASTLWNCSSAVHRATAVPRTAFMEGQLP